MNGGQTKEYHWEQSLLELTVFYYLPDGTKAKDISLDLDTFHCKLKIKGEDKYRIDAPWYKKIKADESLWTVERDVNTNKAVLQICITKHVGQNWWKSVCQGHPEVDGQWTPENTKIHELDAESRYHVEKQMFDQRAKERGEDDSE